MGFTVNLGWKWKKKTTSLMILLPKNGKAKMISWRWRKEVNNKKKCWKEDKMMAKVEMWINKSTNVFLLL